jgi:multiple sugar transport system permease protein
VANVLTPPRPEAIRPPARPAAAGPRFGRQVGRHLRAHAFLFGALVCFALFTWFPMIREIVMSFQHVHRGQTSWVGFRNYSQIWHDPFFWQAWRNTVYFTALALVLGFALPFAIAIVLNEFRHASGYLRILVYLPVMLPPVASLLLYKYFTDPGYGLFNQILHFFHLPTSHWLADKSTAMPSLVLVSTWANMGGATLIYLAALQGIPGELYEAAEIDGAGILGRIRHVTIPQTRLILSLMLMLQIVATMQMFVEAFTLTGGGPEGSTTSVVYQTYNYAFNFNNLNAASAFGVILLIVLGVFSAVYVLLERRGNKEG